MDIIELLKVIFLGIVEGITESKEKLSAAETKRQRAFLAECGFEWILQKRKRDALVFLA